MPNKKNEAPQLSQPVSTDNGGGSAPAYSEPLLGMSAPAGILILTPQSATFSAGNTTAIVAGHDINLMAQGNAGHCVKDGISMFAHGKASDPNKPNQETGIKLHAASGAVSSQSQSSATKVTADKSITVASTTASVMVQAKEHILLTAQGAYIKMDGMNIEICAPGMVDFKASLKSFTGAKADSTDLKNLPQPENVKNSIELNYHYSDLEPVPGAPYKITFADGTSRQGKLDTKGYAMVKNVPQSDYHVEYGEESADWKAAPLSPDPLLGLARQQQAQARAHLETLHKQHQRLENGEASA